MTVQQLLANTTSRELSEWMAFFRIENEDREKKDAPPTQEELAAKAKAVFGQFSR